MMSKIGIFMADGCEEIEGLTVVDIVRRAKMDITMISVNGKREVTSSHDVTFFGGRCGGRKWIMAHLTGSCCRAECREHCICSTMRR